MTPPTGPAPVFVIPSPTSPFTDALELLPIARTFCSGCGAGVFVMVLLCIGVPSTGELGVAMGCELALADVLAEMDVEEGAA
jgi:hypothetical protein